MNSVFIADDESLVIKSLRRSVDWNQLGYEVIGEAGNGIEAYEKILECRPDIVFTDIRMPGLSGLELIKKVSDAMMNTQFVVMSGYAEFIYVQKALSYGALGYCLKPFDENEIEKILKKASSIIQRNKWSLETEMLSVIDDISEYGSTRRKELIRLMGFQWEEEEGFYVIANQEKAKTQLNTGNRAVSFKIGKNRYAQLVPANKINEILEKFSLLYNEDMGSLGVSKVIYSPDDISEAVEEACIALNHYFVTGKKYIFRYFEPEKRIMADSLLKLRNSVSSGDVTEMVKLLDALAALFLNGEYNVIQAFQVYSVVMYANATASNNIFESMLYNYEQLMSMFQNVKEMLAYLKTVIRQTEKSTQYLFTDIHNETLRNILEYVNEHYSEEISIQSIAKRFNVNPCYLSQLFRKDTGMTFTEYITDLRIKYACTLLKTSGIAINEVSEKAGFSDYYYFTRVFKKMVGNTPTQYRGS